jgi:hypothetical protein
MNTQKLIAITAGAAFILAAAATSASAQVDPQITGDFNVYVPSATASAGTVWTQASVISNSNGGIDQGQANSYNGASTTLASSVGSIGNGTGSGTAYYGANNAFNVSYTGEPSPNYALISLNPPSGSESNSSGTDDVATIDVDFTNLAVTIGSNTYDATSSAAFSGTFSADYNGTLSCASGDAEGSSGQTDCIEWSGTGGAETDVVSLTGTTDTLDITLQPYTDWNLHPSMSFDVVTGGSQTVPEPASIVLFASGLAALPILRRRLSRKAAKRA